MICVNHLDNEHYFFNKTFFFTLFCRLLYLPCALIAGVLGFMVDMPVISMIALFKSLYMIFKGWHRLFHDLIGREGPFLETICVPFAGLAILLWPLAVVGAVMASIIASIFLGAFAGVVVYQVILLSFIYLFLVLVHLQLDRHYYFA